MIDIGVIGSRNYPHEWLVRTVVAGMPFATYPKEFRIVSGGAGGVDTWAEEEADLMGYPVMVIEADWKTYKRGAGILRNIVLVDTCHMMFAFWDGISPGTRHAIKYARETETPITVFGAHYVGI